MITKYFKFLEKFVPATDASPEVYQKIDQTIKKDNPLAITSFDDTLVPSKKSRVINIKVGKDYSPEEIASEMDGEEIDFKLKDDIEREWSASKKEEDVIDLDNDNKHLYLKFKKGEGSSGAKGTAGFDVEKKIVDYLKTWVRNDGVFNRGNTDLTKLLEAIQSFDQTLVPGTHSIKNRIFILHTGKKEVGRKTVFDGKRICIGNSSASSLADVTIYIYKEGVSRSERYLNSDENISVRKQRVLKDMTKMDGIIYISLKKESFRLFNLGIKCLNQTESSTPKRLYQDKEYRAKLLTSLYIDPILFDGFYSGSYYLDVTKKYKFDFIENEIKNNIKKFGITGLDTRESIIEYSNENPEFKNKILLFEPNIENNIELNYDSIKGLIADSLKIDDTAYDGAPELRQTFYTCYVSTKNNKFTVLDLQKTQDIIPSEIMYKIHLDYKNCIDIIEFNWTGGPYMSNRDAKYLRANLTYNVKYNDKILLTNTNVLHFRSVTTNNVLPSVIQLESKYN